MLFLFVLTPPDKWPYQLLYYIANCKLTKNNNRIEERHANFKWYINRKLHVPVIDIGINDDKLGRRFFLRCILLLSEKEWVENCNTE